MKLTPQQSKMNALNLRQAMVEAHKAVGCPIETLFKFLAENTFFSKITRKHSGRFIQSFFYHDGRLVGVLEDGFGAFVSHDFFVTFVNERHFIDIKPKPEFET